MPCGLREVQPQEYGIVPIPGSTYNTFFVNDATLEIFQFITQPINTLSASTATEEGIRYDGLIQNSNGDLLLKVTSRGSDGAEFLGFFALVANGELLLGLINAPLKYLSLLNSVDLIGTDGSELVALMETGLPTISEIREDRVVVLDDGTIWQINANAAFQIRDWSVGDRVYASGAARYGGSFFLTNTRDFVSVFANFLG